MTNKPDTLMTHTISGNLVNNAARFSHNSVQGHHHSVFGIQYYADKANIRWAMGVGALLDPNSAAARYGNKAILKRPLMGCGVIISKTQRILVMPDLHIPYQHKDAFLFLQAVYEAYNCNMVLNVGDLVDHHRGSYHESEGDSYSEEDEYYVSMRDLHELQEMFPKMVITSGNHDAIPKRKLKSVGLPPSMLSNYNKLYNLKSTWIWTDEHWFDSKGGTPILIPMILKENGRWNKKINL